MCEFATYGIPLITSDIPICREMLADFDNVFYINNSSENLTAILKQISFHDQKRNMKFSIKNTVQKELELFNEIMIWKVNQIYEKDPNARPIRTISIN